MGDLSAEASFEALLGRAERLHSEVPALRDFCDWPRDLTWSELSSEAIPAAGLVADWVEDRSATASEFHAAVRTVSPYANWRRTYSEAEVGAHFLANYGYFVLFGPKGHFRSSVARGFVAYWGRGLHYDWHHHEAEEIYFVVAGGATFMAEDVGETYVIAGETQHHQPWQDHAMTTSGEAVLTFVLWKGSGLEGLPEMRS